MTDLQSLLPPLNYRLWLPALGAFVRTERAPHRTSFTTVNRADSLALPEARALRLARRLIRRTGQVIELRPVEPMQSAAAAPVRPRGQEATS